MIILDTNFIFALKAKKDKNYIRANEILEDLFRKYDDLIITSYFVLNEIFTLTVSRYNGLKIYLKYYYDLFWGPENFFKIMNFENIEYMKIYQILEKYCDNKRQLSFVDASLIYLYKKLEAKYLISFDIHFDNILNRLY
ncbi:MAG: type II toxin-antitoxin system VapC family toxin [Candidatus Lokiarchaeota archaeon]|nr:type II toxin-antitoxin system VapC family toxin [Candidatus Lokiarchaeota archaeon]